VAAATGDVERELTRLLEVLNAHQCLAASPRLRCGPAGSRQRATATWPSGACGLVFGSRISSCTFDPSLVPWFTEARSFLCGALLPRPAALFLDA